MNSELKFFTRQEYKKPYAIQPHTHPCFELVYYLSGSGVTTVNGMEYEFSPGSIILTQANDIHSERATEPVVVLFIGFITDHTFVNGPFFTDLEEKMLHTIMEIETEMKRKDYFYEAVVNLLTEKLLYQIQRSSPREDKRKSDFAYILNYMHANANQNITVEQIAYTLGYNYDYFRQLFIKNVGQSAKNYLMHKNSMCLTFSIIKILLFFFQHFTHFVLQSRNKSIQNFFRDFFNIYFSIYDNF